MGMWEKLGYKIGQTVWPHFYSKKGRMYLEIGRNLKSIQDIANYINNGYFSVASLGASEMLILFVS